MSQDHPSNLILRRVRLTSKAAHACTHGQVVGWEHSVGGDTSWQVRLINGQIVYLQETDFQVDKGWPHMERQTIREFLLYVAVAILFLWVIL